VPGSKAANLSSTNSATAPAETIHLIHLDEPVVHVIEELSPAQEEIETLVNETRAFLDEVDGIELNKCEECAPGYRNPAHPTFFSISGLQGSSSKKRKFYDVRVPESDDHVSEKMDTTKVSCDKKSYGKGVDTFRYYITYYVDFRSRPSSDCCTSGSSEEFTGPSREDGAAIARHPPASESGRQCSYLNS